MSEKKNHLTRSLKNDRSKKELLRTEINNATDPNVRLELTKLLLEIEDEEKKKKQRRWIILCILIIGIILLLFYLGTRTKNEIPLTKASEPKITTNSEKETKISTTEQKIDETNLTEPQLKEWVMSILDLLPPPPSKYILRVSIDDTDKLAYIHADIDQMDGFGTFRVNAKGQLQLKPYMSQSDWILMSEHYMDTSIAEEYFNEHYNQNKHLAFDEAVDLVINNSEDWIDLSDEEKQNIKILSINNKLTKINHDEKGDYYTVVLETNKEPKGTLGSCVQFKVYLDGSRIEQRSMGAGRDEWININVNS